jgi:hypothetical protein
LGVPDGLNSTVSVLLQPGLSGPNATLSPTIMDFGTQLVGTSSPGRSVTLSNNGTGTLSIASITPAANFGETDDCGSSLAAGTSCTIIATFAPTGLDKLPGMLSITDNAPASPQTVSMDGTGTVVNLSVNSVIFNCSGGCPAHAVMLTNTGATTLSISSITINSNKNGNDHGGFAQTNNCTSSLGAGQSCSITISFIGGFNFEYVGALLVADNGGGSPQTVSLKGFAAQ